jgi:hypothetical protein
MPKDRKQPSKRRKAAGKVDPTEGLPPLPVLISTGWCGGKDGLISLVRRFFTMRHGYCCGGAAEASRP